MSTQDKAHSPGDARIVVVLAFFRAFANLGYAKDSKMIDVGIFEQSYIHLINTLRRRLDGGDFDNLRPLTDYSRQGRNGRWLTPILIDLGRCGFITLHDKSMALCTDTKARIDECTNGSSRLNTVEKTELKRAAHEAVFYFEKLLSPKSYY